MTIAPITAGITAAVVGCGGSIAVVFAAAEAANATPAQTASWVAGICGAIALSSALLSLVYRMPIITAWSTPGAALIAATPGLSMPAAVAAFCVAATLIILTALVRPLGRLLERLPMPIASAMLAGVLLKIVVGPFESLAATPLLVLPLIAVFLIARLFIPAAAILTVLAAGVGWSAALGLLQPLPPLSLASVEWIAPLPHAGVAFGLGIPLYLVTMASQNLAGFAVLRASGYDHVPASPILAVTGLLSLVTAPLGAHTSNLAAISAAICTGPDCHPDPARRWRAGLAYAATYLVFTAFAPSLVALFSILPAALVKTVAGLALAAALVAALTSSFSATGDKFAPGLTFAVTASGLTLFSIGGAFWGLIAGLVVHAMQPRASTTPPATRER